MTTLTELNLEILTHDIEVIERLLPRPLASWLLTLAVLLRVASLWVVIRLMEHEIKATPAGTEIDPEDRLTDHLLRLQRQIHALVYRLDQSSAMTIRMRLMRRALVRLHRYIGELRIWVLEHDADCSPLHGPYYSVEELIEALDAEAEKEGR